MKSIAIAFACLIASGCADSVSSPAAKAEPPAQLHGPAVKEAELVTIALTAEAEKRLGVRVENARAGSRSEVRQFTGEVTTPTGSSIVVSSSVAGTLQAAPAPLPPVGTFVRKDQPLFFLNPFLPLSRD